MRTIAGVRLGSPRSVVGPALMTLFAFVAVAWVGELVPAAVPRQGPVSPGTVETLRAVGGLSPDVVGRFREPLGFAQHGSGEYFVFDRRGHTVHGVDASGRASRRLVQIGGEEGRLIEPGAFSLAPDGTFAIADAPRGLERVQFFDREGTRLGGFSLPGRALPRITLGGLALSGVGTIAFTGRTVLMNQPETGWLVTEYTLRGAPFRSIGSLRPTGHEFDRDLHLALNAAIPVPHPGGGLYVVFYAGAPVFRRYDARGDLLYERVMQGRELDPFLAALPTRWPRRSIEGRELPLVVPTVRAAAVDRAGALWVSFTVPYTYVYDPSGEKIRTVQFRAAGLITPASLAFAPDGRLLVTPGCYAFDPAPAEL